MDLWAISNVLVPIAGLISVGGLLRMLVQCETEPLSPYDEHWAPTPLAPVPAALVRSKPANDVETPFPADAPAQPALKRADRRAA